MGSNPIPLDSTTPHGAIESRIAETALTLRGHSDSVTSVIFLQQHTESLVGFFLASDSLDDTIKLWKME
jgi:WD40 repeat protein